MEAERRMFSDMQAAAMNAVADKFHAELPAAIRFQQAFAQLIRARFVALMQAGFSEEQALELVKGLFK